MSVGFVNLGLVVGVSGGCPLVFVEVPVVVSAEEDEVGGSSSTPVEDVVGLGPVCVVASGEPAAAVAVVELSS